jgi:hypothetical protein
LGSAALHLKNTLLIACSCLVVMIERFHKRSLQDDMLGTANEFAHKVALVKIEELGKVSMLFS